MCGCIYGLVGSHTVSHGLVRSRTVSHGLSLSCTIANTIIPCQFFKSFKNHTRLSRIHSNGPRVTRIRPRLVRLYVRFTRMANRISRVFCVIQALKPVSHRTWLDTRFQYGIHCYTRADWYEY